MNTSVILLTLFQGRKLLIIGTTSQQEILQEMGMLSAFSAIVHISNLSLPEHLTTALEELGSFTQKELCSIAKMVEGKR